MGIKQKIWLTPEQQKLATQWMNLARKIAREIARSYNEDIIAECMIGLCIAASKFDKDRGYKFSTYAVWWIRAYGQRERMRQAGGDINVIKTNTDRDVFFKIPRARHYLVKMGIIPNTKNIAEHIGTKEENVRHVLSGLVPKVQFLHSNSHNDMIKEVADGKQLSDEVMGNKFDRQHNMDRFNKYFKRLDERERAIIGCRWLSENPLTLRKMGDELGLSRERVRQIEEKALDKLRTWMGANKHKQAA